MSYIGVLVLILYGRKTLYLLAHGSWMSLATFQSPKRARGRGVLQTGAVPLRWAEGSSAPIIGLRGAQLP